MILTGKQVDAKLNMARKALEELMTANVVDITSTDVVCILAECTMLNQDARELHNRWADVYRINKSAEEKHAG